MLSLKLTAGILYEWGIFTKDIYKLFVITHGFTENSFCGKGFEAGLKSEEL